MREQTEVPIETTETTSVLVRKSGTSVMMANGLEVGVGDVGPERRQAMIEAFEPGTYVQLSYHGSRRRFQAVPVANQDGGVGIKCMECGEWFQPADAWTPAELDTAFVCACVHPSGRIGVGRLGI